MKYIKGFFLFWYDFIVGDAWEVAAGVVLCLIAIYAIIRVGGANNAGGVGSYAAILFPLVIIALLSYSLWRVRRSG